MMTCETCKGKGKVKSTKNPPKPNKEMPDTPKSKPDMKNPTKGYGSKSRTYTPLSKAGRKLKDRLKADGK